MDWGLVGLWVESDAVDGFFEDLVGFGVDGVLNWVLDVWGVDFVVILFGDYECGIVFWFVISEHFLVSCYFF